MPGSRVPREWGVQGVGHARRGVHRERNIERARAREGSTESEGSSAKELANSDGKEW